MQLNEQKPNQFFVPADWREAPWEPEAVEFACRNGRVLIPLPTGAGKTFIALKSAYEMNARRVLVTCRGNGLWTWMKNIQLHMPWKKVVVVSSKLNQAERLALYRDTSIDFLVTRARSLLYDLKTNDLSGWDLWIGDESHRYLRKHQTPSYRLFEHLGSRIPKIITLTASPTSKGRQEYWPTLHLFNPKRWSSYWRFVNQFVYTQKTGFGMQLGGPRNTRQFRDQTKDYIYAPSMPITGIPVINRQLLPVEIDSTTAELYEQMWQKMYIDYGENFVIASTTLAKIVRIRQLLCCPKILDPTLPYGAAIEATLQHMDEPERKHAVWFTPFTDAIPFMVDALKGNGYKSQAVFRGGMSIEELRAAEELFRNEPDSQAICSIAFSESFELETAALGYFIGYDFDPEINGQAEGRIARLTSKGSFKNVYYLQCLNTYDERMLEINGVKASNTKMDKVKVSAQEFSGTQ